MIRVTMELDVHGKGEVKRILAVIVIANDGTGTTKIGNYVYALSHSGKYLGKRKEPLKEGFIKGFKRSLSPYILLQRVLEDAGFAE